MRQYRERRIARSMAGARPARRRRTIWRHALVLAGAAAAAIGCAKSEEPPAPRAIPAMPESILLAEAAPPFYSLQESSGGGQWIAVFADAADLTLRLARGSLAAPQAHADEVMTIDRVDLVPGINPYFGRHAYLQHDGFEHLFYIDQELADTRVTKWIHRPVDSSEPWTVDMLPESVVPVGVLPARAEQAEDAGESEPAAAAGFTLFGLLDANGAPPLLAYEVRPALLEEQAAPIRAHDWSLPDGAVPAAAHGAPGPALSPFHCGARYGLSLPDQAGLLVVESGLGSVRVQLPGRDAEHPPALSVACSSKELLVVSYAKNDHTAGESSDAAAPGAYEIIALAIDGSGAGSTERKITLAREVRALAVFPDRWQTGEGAPPELTVLFSELAVSDSGEPEYRLSLVLPDAVGSFRKLILVRGAEPVQDARALRTGGTLAVLFRRANQLRMLLVDSVPPPSGGGSQSAGGW